MKLSKNFTLEEMRYSETATLYSIDNYPNAIEVGRLGMLAKNVLQPIRDYYGKSVLVTSGFRCMELNRAIGGANKSQHLKGEAADIVVAKDKIGILFEWTVENIDYDQIILERSGDREWIHISYKGIGNRNEALTYDNGVYVKYFTHG
jgi:zinc D-Ala-D-Ala carboxypeptidase